MAVQKTGTGGDFQPVQTFNLMVSFNRSFQVEAESIEQAEQFLKDYNLNFLSTFPKVNPRDDGRLPRIASAEKKGVTEVVNLDRYDDVDEETINVAINTMEDILNRAGAGVAAQVVEVGPEPLQSFDLSSEAERTYIYAVTTPNGETTGTEARMTIEKPVRLWCKANGATHRVLDADGTLHIVPAPGYVGCAVEVEPYDPADPVQF